MAASTVFLAPLMAPVALRPDFIAMQQTALFVKQHFSLLDGHFTAQTPDGTTILTSKGNLATKSAARTDIKDASGLPLFSLKMSWFSSSHAWYLELPDGGHRVLSVNHKTSSGRVELDLTLTNAATATHEQVMLQVIGDSSKNKSSTVLWQGRPVALVRNKPKLFTSGFEVELAAGMDQALVGSFEQTSRARDPFKSP